ncbi:MAG: mechanosensitive ion channel [Myxococcales bacterium FL481]|nr:MAG: mechanosensitive ion channel [Myxococcales bacterium FL481]
MVENLNLPPALAPYTELIESVAVALLLLIGGWIVARWAKALTLRVFRKRQLDEAVARFVSGLVQYGVLAAAIIAVLETTGVQTTSFVALLGSLGLAVGLALQGNLGHFASGVLLLVFRPFGVGDVVTVAGSTGRVEEIGLFATTLIAPDNETIIVPNGAITAGTVVNITTRGTRRGAIEVGVAYGTEIELVMKLLKAAAQRAGGTLDGPEPAVAFIGFGASSLDFKVLAWSRAEDYLGMLHNLREETYKALNEAGIDIPFQQVVVRRD